jgi:hypothetical protein
MILVGKPEGKGPLGRHRRRWDGSITNWEIIATRNSSGAFDLSLSLDVTFLNISQKSMECCNTRYDFSIS